ncbi:protein of unknown function [Aminobacter niigataensis]|nr:protein of unknown function [Aminobacter niigataensis]
MGVVAASAMEAAISATFTVSLYVVVDSGRLDALSVHKTRCSALNGSDSHRSCGRYGNRLRRCLRHGRQRR